MYGNVDRCNDAELYVIDKTARVGMTITNHLALLLPYLILQQGSQIRYRISLCGITDFTFLVDKIVEYQKALSAGLQN